MNDEGPELPVASIPQRGHVVELAERVQPPTGWIEVHWERGSRFAVRPKDTCPMCLGRGRIVTQRGSRYCDCIARRIKVYLDRLAHAVPAPLMRRGNPGNKNEKLEERIGYLQAIIEEHDQAIAVKRDVAQGMILDLEHELGDKEADLAEKRRTIETLRARADDLEEQGRLLRQQAQELIERAQFLRDTADKPIDTVERDKAYQELQATHLVWDAELSDPKRIRRYRTQLKRLLVRLERRRKRTAPAEAEAVRPG